MEVLLDVIRSVDYDILLAITSHWRGGVSDTVWTFFSLIGNAGAVWIVLAIALLCFRKTRRAGAAILVALVIGALVVGAVALLLAMSGSRNGSCDRVPLSPTLS